MPNQIGPDEALAAMAKTGAPREPIGDEAFAATNRSADPGQGTLIPKKSAKGVDPAITAGGNVVQPHIPTERLGPRFAVRVAFEPAVDPVAAPTQANGRIINPAIKRTRDSFDDGSMLGY